MNKKRKYCGLVIDESCLEQDGQPLTFSMLVEANSKMVKSRLIPKLNAGDFYYSESAVSSI